MVSIKIDSGRKTFEFEDGPGDQKRTATMPVLDALLHTEEPEAKTRADQLRLLREYVKKECDLDISGDEANGLFDALQEVYAERCRERARKLKEIQEGGGANG